MPPGAGPGPPARVRHQPAGVVPRSAGQVADRGSSPPVRSWPAWWWGLAPLLEAHLPALEPVRAPRSRPSTRRWWPLPRYTVVSAYYPYVSHIDHRTRIYMWPTPFSAQLLGALSQQEGQRLSLRRANPVPGPADGPHGHRRHGVRLHRRRVPGGQAGRQRGRLPQAWYVGAGAGGRGRRRSSSPAARSWSAAVVVAGAGGGAPRRLVVLAWSPGPAGRGRRRSWSARTGCALPDWVSVAFDSRVQRTQRCRPHPKMGQAVPGSAVIPAGAQCSTLWMVRIPTDACGPRT